MINQNTGDVYETNTMIFITVKSISPDYLQNIKKILGVNWTPNITFDRNRVIYNKQTKAIYDLEINDRMACLYTLGNYSEITNEHLNNVIDFLTISIKKVCDNSTQANYMGFIMRYYKKK